MARPEIRLDPNATKYAMQLSTNTDPKHVSIFKWWPEFLGWTTSVLIAAAIIAVLQAFDGETTARWQSQVPITLNAVLSLLVTFLYMALMVPIPKCIAQLKWNHYTTGRPLSDVELFDEASRTVWGSAVLLVTRPNRLLAALGAFLTLAVAGVGPFVQQILNQEVEPRQVNATIPTVPIFNLTSPYSGTISMVTAPTGSIGVFGISEPSVDGDAFDAALYAGLIAPEPREFPFAPNCAAANCTWSPYWTLVVESECSNLTDRLSRDNDTWSLPNGLKAGYPYGLATNFPSVAFQDRGHLLLDFFATASDTRIQDNEQIDTAAAVECILQLRARKVRAEYKNGTWSETPLGPAIAVNTLEARGCSPWRRGLANGQFDLPADAVDQTGETFKVFKGAVQQDPLSAQWFSGGSPREPLTSTCNITIPVDPSNSNDKLLFPALHLLNTASRLILLLGDEKGDLGDSGGIKGGILNYLVSLVSQDPSTQSSLDQSHKIVLTERVDNIAKSLTQTLRSSYFENTVSVAGEAYKDTAIYRVTWYWVIVPASLVLLTLVLLILTAWNTSYRGLEKRADSSLALMVFGCDQELRESLASAGDLAAVTKIAKETRVRLGLGHVLTLSEDLQSKG